MALTPPTQLRALDPYSDNRYSSTINRFTRLMTNGRNVVLFPDESFTLTRASDTTITVGAGMCVKDDILIHISEAYTIDFTDDAYYEDTNGGLTASGYYYIVLKYLASRSYPSPSAYIKLIKTKTLYTNYLNNYIFLGAAKVVSDGGVGFILDSDPTCTYTYDPSDEDIARPVGQQYSLLVVDGGTV